MDERGEDRDYAETFIRHQQLRVLSGHPWLPCPICKGSEGCDHSYLERARADGHNIVLSGQDAPP